MASTIQNVIIRSATNIGVTVNKAGAAADEFHPIDLVNCNAIHLSLAMKVLPHAIEEFYKKHNIEAPTELKEVRKQIMRAQLVNTAQSIAHVRSISLHATKIMFPDVRHYSEIPRDEPKKWDVVSAVTVTPSSTTPICSTFKSGTFYLKTKLERILKDAGVGDAEVKKVMAAVEKL